MFSRQLSYASLINLCRALRHGTAAGLTLVRLFRQQAEHGPRPVRPLAGRLATVLEQGYSLQEGLEREQDAFPAFFLSLASVGEETGHLVEVFGELENYYCLQDKLRKDFRSQALMPLIQLALAFVIIGGLIFILAMIAASRPGSRAPALFGFRGPIGSVLFLTVSLGSMGLFWFLTPVLGRLVHQQPGADALLWRLPIIGSCWEALTMSRFTLALGLTLDTGMSVTRALRLSLVATTNAMFEAQAEKITEALKRGCTLLEALTRSGLFSGDFLSVVAIGEEGGRVPEMMRRQADYWNEEASRRLKLATRLASLLVWAVYAVFMAWAIFTIYLGALA